MSCNKQRENVRNRCPLQKVISIHLSEKTKLKITERHADQELFCETLSITSLYADLAPTLILLYIQLLSPPMTKSILMIAN